MDHFFGCTTKAEALSRMGEIKKQFSEWKRRHNKNKSYTVTNSPCGWVTKTTGSPCLKPGFVEHNGRCQLHKFQLNAVTPERCMRISKKNPCHVTFISGDNPDIVVEDAGGRVGLELEVQGLFTDDHKQWKPEMGAGAIEWDVQFVLHPALLVLHPVDVTVTYHAAQFFSFFFPQIVSQCGRLQLHERV